MERLHYKTRIKEFLQEHGFKMHSSVAEELDEEIQKVLQDAMVRAERNDRSTVMGRDL